MKHHQLLVWKAPASKQTKQVHLLPPDKMKHHQLLVWKAPASKQKQFHLKFYDWKYDDVVISVLRSIRLPRKPCNFVEYLDEKELY